MGPKDCQGAVVLQPTRLTAVVKRMAKTLWSRNRLTVQYVLLLSCIECILNVA